MLQNDIIRTIELLERFTVEQSGPGYVYVNGRAREVRTWIARLRALADRGPGRRPATHLYHAADVYERRLDAAMERIETSEEDHYG